jgi:hypothetical protein
MPVRDAAGTGLECDIGETELDKVRDAMANEEQSAILRQGVEVGND